MVVACLGVLSDCALVHRLRDIVYCLGDIMYVIVGLFTVSSPGDCVSDCVIVHCFGDFSDCAFFTVSGILCKVLRVWDIVLGDL